MPLVDKETEASLIKHGLHDLYLKQRDACPNCKRIGTALEKHEHVTIVKHSNPSMADVLDGDLKNIMALGGEQCHIEEPRSSTRSREALRALWTKRHPEFAEERFEPSVSPE